ncbi:MAG: cobalamin biosynthesis protein CbiA [candidate division Zixibacteria bacterium]|nr:cobalamin biosynthesis protein CbiA [candidate division Zixibacteria bacterium]
MNLAKHLIHSQPEPVALADLDIVNPYFRSRETVRELTALGVTALVPPGDQIYAELPIIIPEIKTAIEKKEGKVILDVGGDDTGARVLSSLSDAFEPGNYELLLVLNASRPFTADLAGCRAMIDEIEAASRMKFTGIISNTHLMDDTSTGLVLEGLNLARAVSEKTGLPVVFLSATIDIIDNLNPREVTLPVLPLDRSLLKPWERRKKTSGTE